jgi:hypothetical protein
MSTAIVSQQPTVINGVHINVHNCFSMQEPNINFFYTLLREMFTEDALSGFEAIILTQEFEASCRKYVKTVELDYLDLIENEPEIWQLFVRKMQHQQIIPADMFTDVWDQVFYPAIIFNPQMTPRNQDLFKCWRKFGMEKWYNHAHPELKMIYHLILEHAEEFSDVHYNWFNQALLKAADPWQAWQLFCCLMKPREKLFEVLSQSTFVTLYKDYFFPAAKEWYAKYPAKKSMSPEMLTRVKKHYSMIETFVCEKMSKDLVLNIKGKSE